MSISEYIYIKSVIPDAGYIKIRNKKYVNGDKCNINDCNNIVYSYSRCKKHRKILGEIKVEKVERTCIIENCTRKHLSKGYCSNHYTKYLVPDEKKIWGNMKNRCYLEKSTGYQNYGGRGIKICNRWLGKNGYYNFINDMGKRPSKKHSIDRINVNGDYSPDNCRWADTTTQAINKRKRHSKSGETGVYQQVNKWHAHIIRKKRLYFVGSFNTKLEAANARADRLKDLEMID